jgi:multicomponent Na+:H+ antiporter subunit E
MRRYVWYVAGLTVAWLMLWDQITLANFLGGIIVAATLLAVFPLPPVPSARRMVVHPVALLRLGGAVVAELLVSNVFMAREILRPRRQLVSGIVRCPMRTDSPKMLSMVANILALSPGTMAVDATDGPPTLYVHALARSDLGDVRRKVTRLERLVVDALGAPADRRAVAAGGGVR